MTAAPLRDDERSGVHARSLCVHCRTPIGDDRRDEYCCHGCREVHGLLSDAGLERYYALRGDRALAPVANDSGLRDEAWLDALVQQFEGIESERRVTLDVQGIQCGACVWLIEALFAREVDAIDIRVNPALGKIALGFGPGFSLHGFVRTVGSFGYRLGRDQKRDPGREGGLVMRAGVCVALALNSMLLSASVYFGLSSGALFELVRNASFVLATLSVLVGGSYFFARAFQSLERKVLHLDLPIAIGIVLSYVGSVASLYVGTGNASYLDTVSTFIAVMLVGRVVQERLVEQNRLQLLATDGARGLLARRVVDGRAEFVPCPELRAGDTLLVCPGELVPVAGSARSEASCTLDWINGESEPRVYTAGSRIPGGAINAGRSTLHVTAASDFESSTLDTLLRDDARATRRAGDFWDAVSRYYVAGVLAAAALAALRGVWLHASLAEILDTTTAVLVVTCPCAFGIATPLAYELGIAALRRRGLYVRDGSFFDRAGSVRRIVFDKTGTLTHAIPSLVDREVVTRLDEEAKRVLYALCANSNHPKSTAIARALVAHEPTLDVGHAEVSELPGSGTQTELNGHVYRLGSAHWALPDEADQCGPVFTRDGVLLARLVCAELARPDAAREVSALSGEGYALWIASGDDAERVRALAVTLGIAPENARGELSPDQKSALIAEIDRRDTLMIGDGINDSLALSRALCSGTPAIDRPFVPARTDFYFLTPGLRPIRDALYVARAVRRVVRHALVFAVFYNLLVVSLCFTGRMWPWLAAVLMPASSLAVLLYVSLRLSVRRVSWKS